MTILRTVLVLAIALVASRVSSAQVPFHPEIPDIDLAQLIDESDSIFVGKVVSNKDYVKIDGLPARVTRLRVLEALKGVRQGEIVAAKELYIVSVPVEVGETVLWYVKGDIRKSGFSRPLHRWVADFRRMSIPARGGPLFINQLDNGTLWSGEPGASLWDETGFSRAVAALYIKKYFMVHKLTPSSQEAQASYIEQLLAIGDRPNVEGPLHLEFLLAATYARLAR